MRLYDLKLTIATVNDAKAIALVELQALPYEQRSEQSLKLSEKALIKLWQERLKCHSDMVVLAFYKQELCGFIALCEPRYKGFIHALYIAPTFMRAGIGSLLVNVVHNLVALQGGHELVLKVQALNLGARLFYKTLHFKMTGVQSPHLIIMRKEI